MGFLQSTPVLFLHLYKRDEKVGLWLWKDNIQLQEQHTGAAQAKELIRADQSCITCLSHPSIFQKSHTTQHKEQTEKALSVRIEWYRKPTAVTWDGNMLVELHVKLASSLSVPDGP